MSGDGLLPDTLRLRVVTPKRLLVEASAESVTLPSLEGELGILPGHRPLFVGIGDGVLRFRLAGEEETFRVSGGYARVAPDEVVVMTELGQDDELPAR